MSRAGGQAWRWARRLLGALFALAILGGLALGALAWRLAQGPMELPALAREIERRVNAGAPDTRLEVGAARVAWEGWRAGHLSPIDFLLEDVRLVEPDSGRVQAVLPAASVSLSLPWLLRGEIAPRVIEFRRPVLRLVRTPEGALRFGFAAAAPEEAAALPAEEEGAPADGGGHAARLLAELMRPPSQATPLAALERIEVEGGLFLIVDRQIGRVWWLQEPNLVLRRRPEGGVQGAGTATLRLGAESVPIRLSGSARGEPPRIELGLALPSIRPGALARAARGLAPLGLLDATAEVALHAALDGRTWRPEAVQGRLRAGAGALDLGDGRRIPIAGLEVDGSVTPAALRIERAVLRLAPAIGPSPPAEAAAPAAPLPRQRPAPRRETRPEAPSAPADPLVGPTITAEAEAHRIEGGSWRGAVTLALDAVRFADLGAYWPEGVAPGARDWMLRNVTDGTVRDGRFRVEGEMASPDDPGGLVVTALSGTAEAADATVHWLRPIPPVEGVAATAEFGLSEIVLRTRGGRQQGTRLEAREGALRFLLGSTPERADLEFRLAGPVQDLWEVLRHSRLRLLDRRRVGIENPSGMLEGRLSLAFPLVAALPVEELRIGAEARLTAVRLPGVLLGHDIERGTLALEVDNDGLRASGTGQFVETPVRFGVEMDFRAGPPDQVISRETVSAPRVGPRSLAVLGADPGEVLEGGTVAVEARHETRRNGQGRTMVRADLRDAALALAPLGWRKPRGQPGLAEAELRLRGSALQSVEGARVEAGGLNLRARVPAFVNGWPDRIELQESRIGGTRLAGTVQPPREGGEWQMALRGPVLDLRQAFAAEREASPDQQQRPATPRDAPGAPALAVTAQFERVVLGERRQLLGLVARARVDGRGVLRAAQARARTAEQPSGGAVAFSLTPQPDGRRRLSLTAEDAGALLRALDIAGNIGGGTLQVDAAYAEPRPGATLSGTADMSDFVVRDAPAIGRLLQALTVYGLMEALRGPGLGFARLVAPFSLSPEAIVVHDGARAFSASLGVTARGTIDRRRNTIDMEGTIVPAYVFNQLLGNIPLLGRLFSPETGGGLFAATFRLRGPLDDPQVMVNPLATLTPGFLRGLFRLFDQPAPAQQ
ncbi:hypothetical protein GCM10010964_40160 [Caldovatus sediminis]|uniref:DUF3971 domain-containing protein n=1 Tax=Caldovatus sediminis TaxID=2041189 RepID=A0A8J2ZEF9_9PROT|nr:AsmA-like C-terminal region-containing protein [Caldovatus sediminis]GGG48756.1 hypothetical protein GCM10010964_40160 [Caldovatus sediminis]